ncbi:MAG: PadR family transcriptional regulator, partial [Geodermatophilaceae bacterium]|nr:PadR family transcriptional regulator [Geodermatophilaceae bacterium]
QLRTLLAGAKAEHEATLNQHKENLARLRKGNRGALAVSTAEFGVAYEKAVLKWLETVPVSGG